jgi:methylmalonyl-CoA mutase C-terminal domain/subunit
LREKVCLKSKKTRVLIGKLGLDGHDRGAKVLVLALRDSGMEVIYTGLRQTPETILKTAVEEDVDVIGLSFMAGTHMIFTPKTMQLLEEEGVTKQMKVLVGGTIPQKDIPKLLKMGVSAVFPIGSSTKQIAEYIKELQSGK